MAYTSDDMEYAVIGCALNDPDCAQRLVSLPGDTFVNRYMVAAFDAIKMLIGAGSQPTLVSVSNATRDLQGADMALLKASDAGYMTAAFGTYTAQLMEHRRRRIITQAAQKAVVDAQQPSVDIESVAGELSAAIDNRGSAGGSISANEALMRFIDSVDEQGHVPRCYTGVANLDRVIGGFRGGKLVVLGARPGVGKTALALWIARHVAIHTGHVLIVSLEMDETEIMARVVSMASGVSCDRFESGKLEYEDAVKAAECYAQISQLPLSINTRANTPLQVRAAAMDLKHSKQGLSLIVVDYIQLMHADERKKSRYEEVSDISRELKLLAQDLGVPILALTQFNRDSEKGGENQRRKPTMAEAKDSGSIEQDANIFLIQHPVQEPKDQNSKAWQVWHFANMNGWECQSISIEKNRQGRTGTTFVMFDKPAMRFRCFDGGAA